MPRDAKRCTPKRREDGVWLAKLDEDGFVFDETTLVVARIDMPREEALHRLTRLSRIASWNEFARCLSAPEHRVSLERIYRPPPGIAGPDDLVFSMGKNAVWADVLATKTIAIHIPLEAPWREGLTLWLVTPPAPTAEERDERLALAMLAGREAAARGEEALEKLLASAPLQPHELQAMRVANALTAFRRRIAPSPFDAVDAEAFRHAVGRVGVYALEAARVAPADLDAARALVGLPATHDALPESCDPSDGTSGHPEERSGACPEERSDEGKDPPLGGLGGSSSLALLGMTALRASSLGASADAPWV